MPNVLVQIQKLVDLKEAKHVGGKVPAGGSNCAKCEYLADNKTDCKNKKFQKWNSLMNKAKKPEVIPGKIEEYCCSFFPVETSKKPGPSTSKLLGLK